MYRTPVRSYKYINKPFPEMRQPLWLRHKEKPMFSQPESQRHMFPVHMDLWPDAEPRRNHHLRSSTLWRDYNNMLGIQHSEQDCHPGARSAKFVWLPKLLWSLRRR
jgi:hypothetical protein